MATYEVSPHSSSGARYRGLGFTKVGADWSNEISTNQKPSFYRPIAQTRKIHHSNRTAMAIPNMWPICAGDQNIKSYDHF